LAGLQFFFDQIAINMGPLQTAPLNIRRSYIKVA